MNDIILDFNWRLSTDKHDSPAKKHWPLALFPAITWLANESQRLDKFSDWSSTHVSI